MRVQTKILILLLVIILVFVGLLAFQKIFERNRLILLFKQEEEHINTVFDKIIELKGAPLQVLAFDYTYWDEMVNCAETNNQAWALENIDSALTTYEANAAWIYNTNADLIYFTNNIENGDALKEILPVKSGKIKKVLPNDGALAYFFVNSPEGLLEIRAATIHPSSDNERKTPLRGYFFVAKLWNNEYLFELSRLCGSNIVINPFSEEENPAYASDPEKGIISLTRKLLNWKATPLVRLTAWKESELIKGFNRSYNKFIIVLIFSISAFLIALLFLLTNWIRKPLQLISRALETENSAHLDPLQDEKTEFGEISRIITGFFDQKEELIVEMERRQEAEEDLRKLNANLEIRIRERTKALETANLDLKNAYSELQQTHNALIQSEKMAAVGLMASGIAHEIKNPIAIILQGAEYLKSQPSCSSLGEEVEMIKKAALRAEKIIKDLLDFSRQAPLTLEEVDCASVIEESLFLVGHQISLSNINIVRKFSPGLPKIKIDADQMKQVFINLLVNAADAMPQGGEVSIGLEAIKDASGKEYFQATFSDTGTGIPEENLKKIFDPFFSTKKKSGSAGLGLAIIHRIVERHKGSISVESKVGVGTSFIIDLPVN